MIIKPINLRKSLLKTGMPADSDFMATSSFSWQVLLTKQTEIPSLEVLNNLLKTAQILQIYRDKVFRMPVTITAGWRSQNYQDKLIEKGITTAKHSYHITGLALDFTVKNWTIPMIYDVMDRIHFGGVEKTDGNWQHIDLRDSNLRFKVNGTVLNPHYSVIEHDKIFRG